ncbi:MAG: hypothetical protein LUD76_01625, partial [Alistipes sp.]|nr:hypothetical protein [Alistipes sp.]
MEENPVVEMHPMELRVFDHNHPDGSSGMSEWYSKTFAKASASANSRLMRLCNNIPEFSFADLKYLSAFSEQKWFFYNKGLETVPPLAQILKENTHRERDLSFSDSIRNIEAAEYILGIDITRNYVLDLIMFYEYNLISKDEGYSILEDLYDLLQTFERICLEGIDPGSGKVIDIYYHSTQIYGNNIEIIKSDNI